MSEQVDDARWNEDGAREKQRGLYILFLSSLNWYGPQVLVSDLPGALDMSLTLPSSLFTIPHLHFRMEQREALS